MKSDEYYIFCISIIKSLKKFTTNSLKHYNNWKKHGCYMGSQKLLS